MSVLSCCGNICLIYHVYPIACCENPKDQCWICLLLGCWPRLTKAPLVIEILFSFFHPFQVKCNNYKQHNPLERRLDCDCICHFFMSFPWNGWWFFITVPCVFSPQSWMRKLGPSKHCWVASVNPWLVFTSTDVCVLIKLVLCACFNVNISALFMKTPIDANVLHHLAYLNIQNEFSPIFR